MSTLQAVELGVLGPLQVRQDGAPVMVPGAKPRAILTMLGLHGGSVVSAETLIDLLWGDEPPRTAAKALQTHISSLRRALGDGFVLTQGLGWMLSTTEVDAPRFKLATKAGRDAAASGDTGQAVVHFEAALTLWRGVPELPDSRRGVSERTRWIEGHAALVEDRADALLAADRGAEIIGDLEAAVADAPLRERRWGQLMLALYRAGRQGEALGAYQRARALLADELGVDPGPELRRLETAIAAQDPALDYRVAQHVPSITRAVTFLLTDIEGSTAAWEADADAMAVALARHDELVEQIVTSRGGRLIKTRGEGDATFSVFERPSGAAGAALELQDAILFEPWALQEPMRIRVALHTGEVELRDGDYFGRAVNRAARLRSLAAGGQILCSGATAELVIDALPDDVVLVDLGMRQLRNLPRPEHVFELRLDSAERPEETSGEHFERPELPAVLTGPGAFVGRGRELEQLASAWRTALAGGTHAVLIAGEPGVGKTRLAGEWSRQAYQLGAVVLYGRSDEDLGAPYQPFAETLRALVPCIGAGRLRGLRGVEALLPLVPGLTDLLPDLAAPTRADPDTERYALFDAVVALLELASASAPVIVVLDDLHWAAKPTLLLLRHLLRFGDHSRVQIVGTYRSTDLDRSHPLAAMLADLHRDGTAHRLALSGLDDDDVAAYVTEAGYDDEELARALASVTGGNPFFLIEALRHVDESGGVWDPSTLPQGVREAVSRRLSRLPAETNKALAAAAVIGSRFALDLVERVVDQDLVDAFDEACQAGIVIEEPGGRYRFNHAIVRQSLLAELASVRRMRLHQRIATTLEGKPDADDELLAELAHHYFECAWAGNAAKAVEYCRRAADQAMARLAYEGAADLYDQALHALEEIDEELPDRDDQAAELLIARCEALLAAGDVASAAGAVPQLRSATADSIRLAAWATCFDGQLSMLIHPERLDEIEADVAAAAGELAQIADAAGEAKAHTVRAGCLSRLGRIGDCESALDEALTAARRARDHRRVNAVLANAPLAALWGPNPVPRAGGRCLDVVRLLRITMDSPAVEATSTRCQAVLEAFRGRVDAARRMIDSARRTVTELGLRHALLEVEQFAGIVELVAGDPAAAEPHLRKGYRGFRRMGLDADTAETAALLGRTCLALDRDAEAAELCTESERLAGHALKASIAWRTLRALLLARRGDHDEARRMAEAAVGLAERTDALVDHGDACLALATVLGAAGDVAGARAAATQSLDLYERKGAAALADMARLVLGERGAPSVPSPSQAPNVMLDTTAVRAAHSVRAAADREDWDEFERLFAPGISIESRRKLVGFKQTDLPTHEVMHQTRQDLEAGALRVDHVVVAVRGDRLALARVTLRTPDVSPGAPADEILQVYGVDDQGRIALQVWFDPEDMDAAIAELDALHARFEEDGIHARRLQNKAMQLMERFGPHFAAQDWDAIAQGAADNYVIDDRRRTVNAGVRRGRDTGIGDLRATAGVGFTMIMSTAVATRGERLVLTRVCAYGREPAAIQNEVLNVLEIDSHDKVLAAVVFDLEDINAAIVELEARYLAGEAAEYSHAWSVITAGYAAFNRHEFSAPDWVNVDHRRARAFEPGELTAYMHATWDLAPNVNVCVESVHRLSSRGAVVTHVVRGTSQGGFDAEWREVVVITVEGDQFDRCEVFDEADVDDAIARFEELSATTPRLDNAARQVAERALPYFATDDRSAAVTMLAGNFVNDDRRRVVGSGIRHGRDAMVADTQTSAELFADVTPTFMAIRGTRLVLMRNSFSGSDQGSGSFLTEVLSILEINTDERAAAYITFDLEDIDAAFAELDARYLAGEAAAHAHSWSVIATGYAAFSRHEYSAPDCVNADHRRARAFEPGELTAYLRATWDLAPNVTAWVEAVHRLSDLGAVVTHVMRGTSQEAFEAEWREVVLITVEGDQVDRCEVFDETDLDDAIARFDELGSHQRQLENVASRMYERFKVSFAARDWPAITEMLADNVSTEDRRRVVNAGLRHGADAVIAEVSGLSEFINTITSETVAIRGTRLALSRTRTAGYQAFQTDLLNVIEIDANDRMVAHVAFDPNDFEAAIAELDARYLAGEGAAHAHSWSVITGIHAALNRQELPPIAPDWVNIDHRRTAAFAPGEAIAYIQAGWELGQAITTYVEQTHRLNDLGAVVTYTAQGISREGFEAEWRGINILTVKGDLVNRSEVFDEADLDRALARFDELATQMRRLENSASQLFERFSARYVARKWDVVAEMLADDIVNDDRRRVVNAGVRRGRDATIASMQATADLGLSAITSTIIATRGERLALSRDSFSLRGEVTAEVLGIVEIDADERIVARLALDADDFDAAIAELDARYLAGEAAAYAPAWSVISDAVAAVSRHELPELTPDWVNIDHRHGAAFANGDMSAYVHNLWDDTRDFNVYIAVVHSLSSLGAVVTATAHGTSQQGFEAEWREVILGTADGNLLSRCELFDETDLDAALARFDELQPQPRRLENTARQVAERYLAHFAARDWNVVATMLAEDFLNDDRRRVVGSGIRHGRDAQIADLRAVTDLLTSKVTQTTLATRGSRLVLACSSFGDHDQGSDAFVTEALSLVEIDADGQISALITFDANEIHAAFAELDARYLAGEAATYARTWTALTGTYAAANKQQLLLAPNCVNIDHRRLPTIETGALATYIRSGWDDMQRFLVHIEAVHRLSARGAVFTQTARATSEQGFEAEWREVIAVTFEDDLVNRCEMFDEADLDAALARFAELHPRVDDGISSIGNAPGAE